MNWLVTMQSSSPKSFDLAEGDVPSTSDGSAGASPSRLVRGLFANATVMTGEENSDYPHYTAHHGRPYRELAQKVR
jgi:hypothetical protein